MTDQARKRAEEYIKGKWIDLSVRTIVVNNILEAHMAGAASALEEIGKVKPDLSEEAIVKVITEWKFAWMNVKGTDEADRKNYFDRAFGIDANMKYGLARRIGIMLNPALLEIATLRAQLEKARELCAIQAKAHFELHHRYVSASCGTPESNLEAQLKTYDAELEALK